MKTIHGMWQAAGIVMAVLAAGCAAPSYEGYKFRPYSIRGVPYTPMSPQEALGFWEEGIASWFDESRLWIFPGKSALGERQWRWSRAAAHKTLPLPCRIRITNLENGRRTVVRVNDRGPFVRGRIVDVTPRVARELGFYEKGLARVRIEVLSVGDGRFRLR